MGYGRVTRRIVYPGPAYSAWVEIPDEWLGAHLLRRDQATKALEPYRADATLWRAALSLVLADNWGGVRGLEGHDPAQWDLTITPVAVLEWLCESVFDDFARAFVVPKAPSAHSGNGQRENLEMITTAGS